MLSREIVFPVNAVKLQETSNLPKLAYVVKITWLNHVSVIALNLCVTFIVCITVELFVLNDILDIHDKTLLVIALDRSLQIPGT